MNMCNYQIINIAEEKLRNLINKKDFQQIKIHQQIELKPNTK